MLWLLRRLCLLALWKCLGVVIEDDDDALDTVEPVELEVMLELDDPEESESDELL